MSLDNTAQEDFDNDVGRLEQMLDATTPAVKPPALNALQRIRERRRRRSRIASGVGAIALVAGSIALGGFAARTNGSLLETEASISTTARAPIPPLPGPPTDFFDPPIDDAPMIGRTGTEVATWATAQGFEQVQILEPGGSIDRMNNPIRFVIQVDVNGVVVSAAQG